MALIATRTTNPLPFQDLEPKRFEDLVRQLIYDFRAWRRLESTGRSGGDEGFDARALEIVDAGESVALPGFPDDEPIDAGAGLLDRLWLIQCKREKVIGPTKAVAHLELINLSDDSPIYGLIFAAACDFSKKTRDAMVDWCRAKSISEVYIWGKGELEDMLFQPKNDNLLFAYFGISLVIRHRTQATQIRAELATKRRLAKTVMLSSARILIRDPAAADYPYIREGTKPSKWGVYAPEKLTHEGLVVSLRWHYAYVDLSTGEWDAADDVVAMEHDHPWHMDDENKRSREAVARLTWDALPEQFRGWLKVSKFVTLSSIVAIDEIGDDIFEGTHLYVPFGLLNGPFDGTRTWIRLTTTSRLDGDMDPLLVKRVERFSSKVRRADPVS